MRKQCGIASCIRNVTTATCWKRGLLQEFTETWPESPREPAPWQGLKEHESEDAVEEEAKVPSDPAALERTWEEANLSLLLALKRAWRDRLLTVFAEGGSFGDEVSLAEMHWRLSFRLWLRENLDSLLVSMPVTSLLRALKLRLTGVNPPWETRKTMTMKHLLNKRVAHSFLSKMSPLVTLFMEIQLQNDFAKIHSQGRQVKTYIQIKKYSYSFVAKINQFERNVIKWKGTYLKGKLQANMTLNS